MNALRYLILVLSAMTSFAAFAEIIHVTGKIVEKENGEPLIAVNVCNTYSNRPDSLLTVTDLDGNFEVDVQEGQLLKFNYISFADTIVPAKKNMYIELSYRSLYENPVWVVDSLPVDIDCPDIWYQDICGGIGLVDIFLDSNRALNKDDIVDISLENKTVAVLNVLFPGICVIKTKPVSIGVIVDGELIKIVTDKAGKLLGKQSLIYFAKRITELGENIIDVLAVDAHNPKYGFCNPVADKFLIICTENQYPNISQTEYRPFQYDNGDDYISDGRFRIVDKEGKIGYATEGGAVIITPRYAFGYPFSNGKAKVTDEGHLAEVEGSNGEYHYWESNNWYWIDKMGNIIR